MDIQSNNCPRVVVSVSEMAAMCGLSRSRFYAAWTAGLLVIVACAVPLMAFRVPPRGLPALGVASRSAELIEVAFWGDEEAVLRAGRAALARGGVGTALTWYRAASAVEPHSVAGPVALASLCAQTDRCADAHRWLAEAERRRPPGRTSAAMRFARNVVRAHCGGAALPRPR